MPAVLECEGVAKTYGKGPLAEEVLKDVSLSLNRGEACALVGPSGSGKTTLLSILGCMLSPSRGELRVEGQSVKHSSLDQLTTLRRHHIGFVFQHAQLLPFLTVEENLRIVGRNAGLARSRLESRMGQILEDLDIVPLRNKRPSDVSGGQRQRVAIARAALHCPSIILADEPTAALDWQHGEAVVRLLTRQARRENALLVTVTHDTRLVGMFDRLLSMDSGRVREP
jgi:putative ABC transport system ATP-binding protein